MFIAFVTSPMIFQPVTHVHVPSCTVTMDTICTAVLNSGDWPEKQGIQNLATSLQNMS